MRAAWLAGALAMGQAVAAPVARSAEADGQRLRMITDTADRICTRLGTGGIHTDAAAKGGIRAEVSGLAKKLATVGGGVEGHYREQRWEGVLPNQVLQAAKQGDDCRKHVFDRLVDQFWPKAPSPPPQPKASVPSAAVVAMPVAPGKTASEAARDYLALVDAGNWPSAFRGLSKDVAAGISQAEFIERATRGRTMVGASVSRELIYAGIAPQQPAGSESKRYVVAYRTTFERPAKGVWANPDEYVALDLVRGRWQVVEYECLLCKLVSSQ